MIDVRLYAHLASPTMPPEFQVESRAGLTVRDVLAEAGIDPRHVFVVMLNNARADLDTPLADGDRLSLFPPVAGG